MDKVIYRNLTETDYETMKEFIGEAFGFNEFVKDKKLLDILLGGYLKECLLESSFGKVAQKDNEVVGFILGSAKKDENRFKNCNNILNIDPNEIDLIINNNKNKELFKEFSKITDTYKELIKERENNFQGCIQLFIVSKKCRGLGIGKSLIGHLFNYMKNMDVKSLYLYTDTRCNYKFYDSQNFKRINEKEIYLKSFKTPLNVFLYGYNF
ncbi:GNAT family N-acetyltransferase [Paraclostridium tenue]|uniref:N-acetyltransferase domain-containing protein n=1 Tax=Paraclostridium tenue TaxID=1737 RepID=A0ABN1LZT9_9FIRM